MVASTTNQAADEKDDTAMRCVAHNGGPFGKHIGEDDKFSSYAMPRPLTEPVLSQALRVFLTDTVMRSPISSTCMSHFESLPALVESSTELQALSPALEAVSLASLANRSRRADLHLEATRRYVVSIRRLRSWKWDQTLELPKVIACIVLLAIYEIINASITDCFHWLQHFHGMKAVMMTCMERKALEDSAIPMLVMGTEDYSSLRNHPKSPRNTSGYLRSMYIHPATYRFSDLCSILPKVQDLFKTSAATLQSESICYEAALQRYRDQAIALKSELQTWYSTQLPMTRPRTIERFTQPYILRFPTTEDFICPVTRADMYNDHFVACMWISYRQCQLHLTNLLCRINRRLSSDPNAYDNSRLYAKSCNEIQVIAQDVCASIPYMLAGEQLGAAKPIGPLWPQSRPPMLIGGLNLIWVLFTISILELSPKILKQDAKNSLLWIGENLGIRQATALAHREKNIPGGITAKGDALKWAGFLI